MIEPRATYRVQLHAGFTFDDAADLTEYLAELGVSHLYCSPYLQAAPGSTHPAVFLIGTVAGQYGFFRSDDGAGAAWTRFNDDAHQFGSLQGNFIAGDENVYGRAYLTTGGRGYVYYDMP